MNNTHDNGDIRMRSIWRKALSTGLLTGLLAGLLLGLQGCQETQFIHVGPNWDALSRLDPDKAGFKVTGKATSPVKLGERIQFEVSSEEPGRLWVFSVDRDDALAMVYPNSMQRDNRVEADETILIPPADADWGIEAVEPAGENLAVFLLTDGDVDFESLLDTAAADQAGEQVMQEIEERRFWGGMTQIVKIEPTE